MVKKKLRLPVLAVVLLAGTFICGTLAGAFMYATGKAVVENPRMLMVSHTEYRYGEAGQIIARLVDFEGNPVTVTACNATILYPDKTKFVNFAGMTASANITGDYYYGFTTPSGPEGVYEYQATCFYAGGVKNASVTNSFHLSSAFNTIQGNLTNVQNNLTALSTQVGAVNASLAGQITALSVQVTQNTSAIISYMSDVNNSLYQAIQNINISVNLSPVLNAIASLNTSMASNFTYTNGLILGVNDSTQASFGVVTTTLGQINTTSNNIYTLLQAVNVTTTNTYEYVAGTLTTKVDNILLSLGIINATVNRIETNTVQINTTVTDILTNQENAVQMSVFSG